MSYNKLLSFLFAFTFFFLSTLHILAKTGKYRLSVRDNPSTSMVIGWDQISGDNPVIYYGTFDHHQQWQKYEYSKKPDKKIKYKSMNNHFVQLKDLKPSTSYFFVIKDSEEISRRLWFNTLPDSVDKKISIIAGGDSRRTNNKTGTHEPRVRSNKMVSKLRPDLILFGGDFTNINSSGQWVSWFNDWQHTISDDGRIYPILPARGNHESSNEDICNLFYIGSEKVEYAITIGGKLLRIYTLNTMNPISGQQSIWLTKDLRNKNQRTIWKMVQYHHPIAPHQETKSYKLQQYNNWAHLFYSYQVDVVVECDAHVSKYTWPLKPSNASISEKGFIRDDKNGTIYIGEGSWGLTRPANKSYKWTRAKGSFTQFKWIIIDKNEMKIKTVKTNNVKKVKALQEHNRFTIPENIELWKPKNGGTISLTK